MYCYSDVVWNICVHIKLLNHIDTWTKCYLRCSAGELSTLRYLFCQKATGIPFVAMWSLSRMQRGVFFNFILYCYPEVVCCEINGIVIKFSVWLFNSIIVIQVIERQPAQRMYFRGKHVWAMSVRTEHSCGFIYHIHALSVLYIKFWFWVRLKPPMQIFLLISLFVFIRDIWRTHFNSMYMLVWLWSSKVVWVQSWWLTV